MNRIMKPTILTTKDLTKSFNKQGKLLKAVNNVSLELAFGESLGIIGESGSGKSTLANMIAGLIAQDTGTIQYNGDYLQMIFQDPKSSFSPKMCLLEGVMEGLRYRQKISTKEMKKRALQALEMVQLPKRYRDKKIGELSGGECQRAAIARAIVLKPQLLICDEITSALDVSIQLDIIKLLQKLKKELSISLFFITHDIAVVSYLCEQLIVLYQGCIVEKGETKTVLNHPQNPYTQELIQSVMTL